MSGPANSLKNCLQIAHGGAGSFVKEVMAIALKDVLPSFAIAVIAAPRSAQIVPPNEEFSTLQPL
jgi:hypothetical protein